MTRPISRLGLADSAPRRILILRALQLGDMLCAVPAFRAIRTALPEAEIVLLGLPWARSFVERFASYLDGFREFPGFPGLPERPPLIESFPSFLANIQRERFDLAIQLHGSGSFVNSLVTLLGARHCAGFFSSNDFCPDPDRFMSWPASGLEIHRLLKLTEFLGAPTQGDHLELPITAADRQALEAIPQASELKSASYVCIHAGASVVERRWPAERFAAVGKSLADQGFTIVLTGTTAESSTNQQVAHAIARPVIDLTGKTDLGSLGFLLKSASLLVSNDTGVSHIAAALQVPSVIISTGDNPDRWAPIDTTLHRVLCRSSGVLPDEVLVQARKLLADQPLGSKRSNLDTCLGAPTHLQRVFV